MRHTRMGFTAMVTVRNLVCVAAVIGMCAFTVGAAAAASDDGPKATQAAAKDGNGVPVYVDKYCAREYRSGDFRYDQLAANLGCAKALSRQISELAASVRPQAVNVCYFDGKAYSEGSELNGKRCVSDVEAPPAGQVFRWVSITTDIRQTQPAERTTNLARQIGMAVADAGCAVLLQKQVKVAADGGTTATYVADNAKLHQCQYLHEMALSPCSAVGTCQSYTEWSNANPAFSPSLPRAVFLALLEERQARISAKQTSASPTGG